MLRFSPIKGSVLPHPEDVQRCWGQCRNATSRKTQDSQCKFLHDTKKLFTFASIEKEANEERKKSSRLQESDCIYYLLK